jgi:hypothetical protein
MNSIIAGATSVLIDGGAKQSRRYGTSAGSREIGCTPACAMNLEGIASKREAAKDTRVN